MDIERLRALEQTWRADAKEWNDRAAREAEDREAYSDSCMADTYEACADELKALIAELGQEVGAVADGELPGMWSASDFTGGDPDERSHAARNVDHSTSMESWFSAIDDTDELFTNAPDERFASRASRVMTYLKANRPTSPAHTSEAREVTDAKCIAIYDAVSRSNITRDVKTPERKAAVVREAMEAFR